MPKVSVVVPVYNCAAYIKRCVQSLQNQTFTDLEILLVDDGSTDDSGTICDTLALADPRIRVFHGKNQGVSAARNIGILQARGEYIAFSDADDFSEPDKIEIQYTNAQKYNVDVSVIGLYRFYSADKKIAVFGTKQCYHWKKGDYTPLKYGLQKKILTMAPYCMLIRRELCQKNLFEEGRAINEDRFFGFMIYAKADGVYYQDVCKYNYVQREDSVSHTKFMAKYMDAIYFANKMEQYVNEKIPELDQVARLNTCKSNIEIFKYLLKTKDGLKEYGGSAEQMIRTIKNYGIPYLFQNLSFLRFTDAVLMAWVPTVYSLLIQVFQRAKKGIEKWQK